MEESRRLAPQLGQKPRRLQLNATRCSAWQLFVFAMGANQIALIVRGLDSYIRDVLLCHVVVTPKKHSRGNST